MELKIWDKDHLEALARKPERMNKMIQLAFNSIPTGINQLQRCLAVEQNGLETQRQTIRELSHSLKGELGTLGGCKAEHVARIMEEAVKEGAPSPDLDQLQEQFAELQAACDQLLLEFKTHLQQSNNARKN